MLCQKCREEIPAGRLKIMPNATHCVPCLEKMGDVDTPVGIMVFDHKTAPALFITNKEHLKKIVRADRRGYKKAARKN